MFTKRFSTQFSQLCDILHYLKNELRMPHHHHHHSIEVEDVELDNFSVNDDAFDEDLTRDEFNLHKLIVAATESGKVSTI